MFGIIILIFAFSLIPTLLSLWILHKAEEKAREGFRAAMEARSLTSLPRIQIPPDQHYIERVGYLIGDISCQFNAGSAYIRCAVNPLGPCQECFHYHPKD